MMNRFRFYACVFFSLAAFAAVPESAVAQTGISVSPPRTYFTLGPGQRETKKIVVSNPSKTHTLELSVSFKDWEYDSLGNNVIVDAGQLATSAASWIEVLPQSFFSLAPGASHEIEVRMAVPDTLNDREPVYTAMLFVTQINPTDGVNEQGANIKIAVQSGVKIYRRSNVRRDANIEITNFGYSAENQPRLRFDFRNTGNVWSDGTITCELMNQETGEKYPLKDVIFYSMPGDRRTVFFDVPKNLPAGKYIATALVDYEHAAAVKIAELAFSHE